MDGAAAPGQARPRTAAVHTRDIEAFRRDRLRVLFRLVHRRVLSRHLIFVVLCHTCGGMTEGSSADYARYSCTEGKQTDSTLFGGGGGRLAHYLFASTTRARSTPGVHSVHLVADSDRTRVSLQMHFDLMRIRPYALRPTCIRATTGKGGGGLHRDFFGREIFDAGFFRMRSRVCCGQFHTHIL